MLIGGIDGIDERTCGTVVTVGMFDGVHLGHRHILSRLQAVADDTGLMPVVVTFDNHPRQVLAPGGGTFQRLTTNAERAELLQRCGVDEVVELHFTPELARLSACEFLEQVLVRRLKARAVVLGYDNMFGSKQHNDFERLPQAAERLGVVLHEARVVDSDGQAVSSTRIREALRRGEVEKSAAMLGDPYRLDGVVEQGFHIGRTMGFPTANLSIVDEGKLLPADGVYAVWATVDGDDAHRYPAMANLGARPTFGSDRRTFEVHLIDHKADLYGHRMTVRFAARLRDIRRFPSAEALAEQLEHDRLQALKALRQ